MKRYYPMAIAVTDDGPELLSTYEPARSSSECIDQFNIWKNHYKYCLAKTWLDVYDGDEKVGKANESINRVAVNVLWEMFKKVPFDLKTGEMEDSFGSLTIQFLPGTPREKIEKWFEETFDCKVMSWKEYLDGGENAAVD